MVQSDIQPKTRWIFDLASSPEAVREVLEDVMAKCAIADIAEELLINLQIVLAEVLNNVVEHAYAEEAGNPIRLRLTSLVDGFDVHVIDKGIALPNGSLPQGDMPKPDAPDMPEGGFGWAMVRALATAITYQRLEGENHLTFRVPHV